MKKSYICIAGGILGLIATVVTAIYTAKEEAREEAEEQNGDDEEDGLIDVALKKVLRYKFVIILGLITGITFTFSVHHYAYQAAGAATAYKILKTQYDDYKASAKEIVGNKKEDLIKSSAVKKEMDTPINILSTGNGTTLLYEPVSRTYYEGSIGDVQRVEKEINDTFSDEDDGKFFYSYREFLDMLGLRDIHLDNPKTEKNIGFYKYDGPITIGYNVQVMDDGRRCVVLVYNLVPRYNFDW